MATAVESSTKEMVRVSFKKKSGRLVLRTYKLPDGSYYVPKDVNGDPTTFTLDKNMTFDVSIKTNRSIVDGFKSHPVYAKLLNIVWLEKEAEDEVNNFDEMMKAGRFVKTLGDGVYSFARVLGRNLKGLSPVEATAKMLLLAKSDPMAILNAKADPSLTRRILLLEGREVGVFLERDGIWYFNEKPIGQNTDAAINWLDQNVDLVAGITKDVKSRLAQ